MARHPFKTKAKIAALTRNNDKAALQAMSQQRIINATYRIKFGLHNDRSIHGACPWEMLHALLLGTCKHIRDCFFNQLGETSRKSDDVNALAVELGRIMSRQSNRNFPKTKFNQGMRRGKLMAKECTGILLCMAAALQTTRGKELVRSRSAFGGENSLSDWIMLVSSIGLKSFQKPWVPSNSPMELVFAFRAVFVLG